MLVTAVAAGCGGAGSTPVGDDESQPGDVRSETLPDSQSHDDVASEEDSATPDVANESTDDVTAEEVWSCFEAQDCEGMPAPPACREYVCGDDHECVLADALDGAPCVPEDPCYVAGACQALQCVGGTPETCDDSNPCTAGECVPMVGCEYSPLEGQCDDGNPCTEDDACADSACTGTPTPCDDANACTDDSCDPLFGCLHQSNEAECDDGDPCTSQDICMNSECVGGVDECECLEDADCLFLLDQDLCVLDVTCEIDGETSTCKVLESVVCQGPDTQCSSTGCNQQTGQCETAFADNDLPCGGPTECVQDGKCQDGACVGDPLPCDVAGPCFDAVCEPGVGCKAVPNLLPCDDGDPCTANDFCTADGTCLGVDTGCGDVPEIAFRLTALKFIEPGFCLPSGANGPCLDATDIVNSFVAQDIASLEKPLVMLGVFDPFDLYGDGTMFYLGPGACEALPDGSQGPCNFSVQPSALKPVAFLAEGECAIGDLVSPAPCFATALGEIEVGLMQIAIPLDQASVSGKFDGMPWPTGIKNGWIRAVLSKATAQSVLVALPLMPKYSLAELLPAGKLDVVNGTEGWTFVMSYEAVQVDSL